MGRQGRYMQTQASGWAGKYKFGVNTRWRPGPVNTNWGPGPGAKQRAGGREIQTPNKKHEDKQQQQSAQRFFSYLFMYNVSLVLCNCFNGKPIFKYVYLPKLISTEQFWSTIRMNTLLAEIWSQYKLWIFKMHYPSPIYLFFR